MFWPIWLLLVLVAAGAHWLALQSVDRPDREALLTMALAWAVMYALAAGAAAFAGERENRTLLFLDTLPVDRKLLWLGKASFALASTVALALALAGLAHLGVGALGSPETGPALAVGFGLVLMEAVIWGLFWSAALTNPLVAGILAVCSLAMASLALPLLSSISGEFLPGQVLRISLRLVLDAAVLAASGWLIARRPRPGWSARVGSRPAGRRRSGRWPDGPVVRSLAWQAGRDARALWRVAGPVGVAWSLLAVSGISGGHDPLMLLIGPGFLVSLAAGVGVFAPGGQARHHQFYAHHGVAPGAIWAVKVFLGAAGLLAYGLLVMGLLLILPGFRSPNPAELALMAAFGFASGLLCGQAIRRVISAVLIALVVAMILFLPQLGLARLEIIPRAGLVLTPVVLLAISRAWAADWLYDLRGSGRWARLALLAVASLGLLLATYVGYRAWGVPDIGPPFPAEASRPPETVRPGEDAEAIYQRASLGLRPLIDPARDPGGEPAAISVARVITNGWDPERRAAVAWWEQNQEAIALTRRGASRPVAPTPGAEDLEVAVDASPRFQNMLELARLMALDARRRQDRGDLAGAWDDILVLLRMGRQMTFRVGTIAPAFAPMVQAQADWLGLDWAADPRQTIELLGAALADLHRMPANAPLGEDVKAQYVQMERFLGLSNDELLARFAPTWLGTHGDVRTLRPLPWPERLVFAWGITPSWERQRARRVIRLLTAERLQSVDNEPWKRHAERATGRGPISDLFWPAAAPTRYFPPEELLSYAEGTPLVRLARPLLFDPEARDRELVLRRALVHVLALRRWQLRHDGRLPEALDELLPSELPGLPMDPYSGRSFGYVHSQGQALPPLRPRDVLTRALPPEAPAPTRPGQRILYSIGPDRGDNQASWDLDAVRAASTAASIVGDITFPLPFDASDHPR